MSDAVFYAALYALGCSLAFLVGIGVSELTAHRWGRAAEPDPEPERAPRIRIIRWRHA